MDGTERVEHEGKVIAVVIRKDVDVGGPRFFTPPEYALQLGVMVHGAGGEIRPHVHKPVERAIKDTQEMVRVDYGKVDVDFYTESGEKLKTMRLGEGDTVLFVSGGHGFRFPEKTKLTEIKQGPYAGQDVDKKVLDV